MNNLINTLRNETRELRTAYVEAVRRWSEEQFQEAEIRLKWSYEDWVEKYPSESIKYRGRKTLSKEGYNQRDKVWSIRNLGYTLYMQKQSDVAEAHYELSIEKLAYRIMKKNLNLDNLKATTFWIDQNINTTLTDGVKTVRAWTIVASGVVQKPHYRYLIK